MLFIVNGGPQTHGYVLIMDGENSLKTSQLRVVYWRCASEPMCITPLVSAHLEAFAEHSSEGVLR